MPKHRSGHYRHQPVNDCRPNANSVRASLPNGHASIFPRIDPTTGIHPMYASRTNPHATQPGMPVNKAHLPIRNFEQLLDQRDLNSIQL